MEIDQDEMNRLVEQGYTLDDVLAHYGIKGMKWGVRRARVVDEHGNQVSTTRKERRGLSSIPSGDKLAKAQMVRSTQVPGRRVQAEGGRFRDAHPDAIKAAQSRAIARNSSIDALSNVDLEALNKRLNLEQNYANLTGKTKQTNVVAKGAGWFGSRVGNVGNRMLDEILVANTKQILTVKGVIPTNGKK